LRSGLLYDTDNLMSGNESRLGRPQLAIENMQIGAADPASPDANKYVVRADARARPLRLIAQGLPRSVQNHCAHVGAASAPGWQLPCLHVRRERSRACAGMAARQTGSLE